MFNNPLLAPILISGFIVVFVFILSIPAMLQMAICRIIWGEFMFWLTPWLYGVILGYCIIAIATSKILEK